MDKLINGPEYYRKPRNTYDNLIYYRGNGHVVCWKGERWKKEIQQIELEKSFSLVEKI
jgi:hypothetical protein